MRVVAFVSEMPGSGKSTLAGHTAVQADAELAGPVVLLDGDPGGGLTAWWRERPADTPIVASWDEYCFSDPGRRNQSLNPSFDSIAASGLEQLAEAGVELVVIDTPNGHTAMAEQAIALADLVVIPTRPNPKDLEIAGAVVDTVEALGTPFVFLINHTSDGDDFPTAAVIALAQHGTVCPVILPQRADLAACQEQGRTVMEMDAESASSEDMVRLWGYLADHMTRSAAKTAAGRERTAKDRRKFPRHRYDQMATFAVGDMVFPCLINDISAGGVSIHTAQAPEKGVEIVLHIPYLGAFRAEPVHIAEDRIGVKFLIDEDEQADLIEQLSKLLRAEPDSTEAAPDAQDGGDSTPDTGTEAEPLPQTATA